MVVRRTTTQSIRRFPVLLVLPFPSSSPVMDAEYGTAKLHQGAGVASQPSPCPSPLPVSSAAASSTPTVSSSMPAPATTVATSSESVEAEAGHIYQPGTKAVRITHEEYTVDVYLNYFVSVVSHFLLWFVSHASSGGRRVACVDLLVSMYLSLWIHAYRGRGTSFEDMRGERREAVRFSVCARSCCSLSVSVVLSFALLSR